MASNEFNWNDRMNIEYAWWENGDVWSVLAQEYPSLFPKGQLKGSEENQAEDHQPQLQPRKDVNYEITLNQTTRVAEITEVHGTQTDTVQAEQFLESINNHLQLQPRKDVHYEIAIPLDRVNDVAEMLGAQCVEIDTVKDMLGGPPDNSGYRTRGTQVKEFLESINNHLRHMDISPLVPADHENWSIAMRNEFLGMAAFRFNWDEDGFVGTWWERVGKEESQEEWNRVAGEYPNLFM